MVVDSRSLRSDRVFHALADPTRRDIMRRCFTEEASVSALARHYPMSVTAVQKHVNVLEKAELVTKRKAGREQLVLANPLGLRRASEIFFEFEQLWRHRIEGIDAVLREPPSEGTQ
ncbi:MAG: ArsR/SmtB family transcription factor [Acidimicrobiales bacterium]